jgi:uncharacterized protein YacL
MIGIVSPIECKLFGMLDKYIITLILYLSSIVGIYQMYFNKKVNTFIALFGSQMIDIIISTTIIYMCIVKIDSVIFIVVFKILITFFFMFSSCRLSKIRDIVKDNCIMSTLNFDGNLNSYFSVGMIYGLLISILLPKELDYLNVFLYTHIVFIIDDLIDVYISYQFYRIAK